MVQSAVDAGRSGNSLPEVQRYRAVETLYHSFLTGSILAAVAHEGAERAAELVFRIFRAQHLEKFLPGLKKLGLDTLPHAVACARYHYLSNDLGGVKVEYVEESDRKAWVRYPPPRWIFSGTAVCGIPSEVSRAMLRAWHAHNGVTLGNPRLGYVCTKQTVDGQPGLEGYFIEHDHDLSPEARLTYAPGEDAPDFEPAAAPRLESGSWPEVRVRKALRNYAMAYLRTALPQIVALFGPSRGGWLAAHTARLVGMQFYDETAALLGIGGSDGIGGHRAEDFATYLAEMATAQGDIPTVEGNTVTVEGWRLMQGLDGLHPAVFDAWNALWEGALSVHNRRLRLILLHRPTAADPRMAWRIE